MAAKLDFEVFYYHMPRRAGVEEGDFHRQSLRWSLPVESIALVLVDVWCIHGVFFNQNGAPNSSNPVVGKCNFSITRVVAPNSYYLPLVEVGDDDAPLKT